MKKYSLWLSLSAWLLMILVGKPALASSAECLEKSPASINGGDPFGAITARDLTQAEHEDIKALLKSLKGSWRGTAHERNCNLRDSSDQTVDDFTIKAKVDVDRYGNSLMEMEFYSIRDKVSQQKVQRFYLSDERFRINDDSGVGDVELTKITRNRIDFFYMLRVQNPITSAGVHKTFYIQLDTSKDAFSILCRTYTQGILSNDHEWHFIRR